MEGHYPSIIFILLVIHYLQQTTPPVLPVLHEMVTPIEKSDPADESEREMDPDISQLMGVAKEWKTGNQQSLGKLLYGLLKWVWFINNYRRETEREDSHVMSVDIM